MTATYKEIRRLQATPLQVAGARQAGLSAVPDGNLTPRQKRDYVDFRIKTYMESEGIGDYAEGMKRLFAIDPSLKVFYANAQGE